MFLVLPCFVDEMVLPKIYCFIIAVFLRVFMLFFYKNQKKNKVDILTVSIILFVSYLLLVSITSRFYLKSIGFLGVVLFYFLCIFFATIAVSFYPDASSQMGIQRRIR